MDRLVLLTSGVSEEEKDSLTLIKAQGDKDQYCKAFYHCNQYGVVISWCFFSFFPRDFSSVLLACIEAEKMLMTNALAYFMTVLITAVKRFVLLALGRAGE